MNESIPSMRADTVHAHGGSDAARVENRPIPKPGPAEVQVAVIASSLNPLDYKARTGELRFMMRAKLPKVLGGDFSGTPAAPSLSRGETVKLPGPRSRLRSA